MTTIVAKTEQTPEEQQAVPDWLHERAREAREQRRQNPNVLEELDELVQRIFDPEVVFALSVAVAEAEDEDSEFEG